jgi:hypothetical protein
MKQNFYTKIFFLLLLFWVVGERAMGQIFTEEFNYGASNGALTTVGSANWTEQTAGSPNVQYDASGSLSFGSYPTNAGKATFSNTGQDIYRQFTDVTSGTLYAGFIMKITAVNTTGDYFAHFSNNGTFFHARLFARTKTGGYELGLAKGGSGGTTAVYNASSTTLTLGTNYFVVLKYDFGTNATDVADDVASVFVFSSSVPLTEPGTPEVTATAGTGTLTELRRFAIRQGTAANAPSGEVDYIRVGTTWADVTSAAATPTLTVSPASLSGFTTTVGSASSSQTYTLSGSSLTPASGNITVTAPANFEVSTDNSTFSASLNVAYNSGTLSATTIYVRIAASAPAGPVSGNVANAGGGATTQNVAVSGTVNPLTPALTVTPASLNPFSTNTNTSSAVQDYIVSASNLTSNLVITAPAGFEIKRSTDATYASSVTLVPTSGNVPNTTINVRLAASNTNAKILIANITNTSGTLTENVAVRGVVNATLANFPDTPKDQLATPQTYTFSAVGLSENLVVTNNDNQNYSLSKDGTNFVSTLTFTPAEVNNNNVTISVRFEPKSDVNGLKPVNLQHSANALTAIVSTEGKQLAPLSIADELAAQTIVFPNPASKFIQVQTSGAYQITLQDVTGRKVGEFISNETINVEKLPNGLYFLQFSNENVRFVKRLIIQK